MNMAKNSKIFVLLATVILVFSTSISLVSAKRLPSGTPFEATIWCGPPQPHEAWFDGRGHQHVRMQTIYIGWLYPPWQQPYPSDPDSWVRMWSITEPNYPFERIGYLDIGTFQGVFLDSGNRGMFLWRSTIRLYDEEGKFTARGTVENGILSGTFQILGKYELQGLQVVWHWMITGTISGSMGNIVFSLDGSWLYGRDV